MIEHREHESYGILQINKFTGNNQQFFGSDLIHSGGISVTVSTANAIDKEGYSIVHGDKQIVSFEMSYSQWLDAITSGMNTQGVPVTLKYANGSRIPQIDHVEDKVNTFRKGVLSRSNKAVDALNNLQSVLSQSKLSKKEKEELRIAIACIKNDITVNTEFVKTLFDEHVEKQVSQAKHEVANYIESKVRSLGLQAIENNNDVVQLSLTQYTDSNELL